MPAMPPNDPKSHRRADPAAERRKRLAEELRANLKRRKAQARAREAEDADQASPQRVADGSDTGGDRS